MAIPFHNTRNDPSKIHFPVDARAVGVRPIQIGNSEDGEPSLYVNSELSLLRFQRRVLEEASDSRNPLLERVKFLAILSSNLDEFFMVRVAGLLQQIESGVETLSIDGRPPSAQLEAIRGEAISLIDLAYATYQTALVPELAAAAIRVAGYASLDPGQRKRLNDYF